MQELKKYDIFSLVGRERVCCRPADGLEQRLHVGNARAGKRARVVSAAAVVVAADAA